MSNNNLLQKLMAARSDEERSWIVIENLLDSLPEDVAKALWAVAIPHWFDTKVLAALCPELDDDAEEIYRQLQKLSCVEIFLERGHNIHELTRNQLLKRLWQDSPQYFRDLSNRAAVYFQKEARPEMQIEWIYHLVVADPEQGIQEIKYLANNSQNSFRRDELEALILVLQEQIQANRTTEAVKAETIYWTGKIKFRFSLTEESLECYEKALVLYGNIKDRLGEANTLQAIGDVLQFLKYQRKEALEKYDLALKFYREMDNQLGMANTLKAIGDVFQSSDRYSEALEKYDLALKFYREIQYRFDEANTLKAIGDVLRLYVRRMEEEESVSVHFVLPKLLRSITKYFHSRKTQILKDTNKALEMYNEAATIYREIGDKLGEAHTLKEIGDVLQFLQRGMEALENYEAAIAIYREIGAQRVEANTLRELFNVLQFLKRDTEALEKYGMAMPIYKEVGAQLGEANTLKVIGDALQVLNRRTEALEKYKAAMAIYREINARWGEANTLQAIGILEEDPVIGLAKSQEALSLYIEIGDKESQSRNLIHFTSKIQLKLGQKSEALSSLKLAAELAKEIDYEPMVNYANQKIAKINRDSQDILRWFDWLKWKLWK